MIINREINNLIKWLVLVWIFIDDYKRRRSERGGYLGQTDIFIYNKKFNCLA